MIEEANQKLTILLQGKIPENIDTDSISDADEQQFAKRLNQLFALMKDMHEFIVPLSRGELDQVNVSSTSNFLGSPFKALHSNLAHLTWQATQVAKGDFSQRVDFMGDFSSAFNFMVESLDNHEKMLQLKISELQQALSHIESLEGILPICSQCKKVRLDDTDPEIQINWVEIERYISNKTAAKFSHSLCPACVKDLYPDLAD